MIDLKIVFAIIFIHWIADFVLQTDWQAQNKSKIWQALILHTFNYSFAWFIIGTIWSISSNLYTNGEYLFSWWIVWKFALITFIAHTMTDYFTSRLNSYLWNKGDVHNFFISVGADQASHMIQLLITYYILTK